MFDDPAPLDARVEFVLVTLRAGGQDVHRRVAASVVQLGVLARILAPALAADALRLGPVSLAPDELWWQDDLGGAYPLSVSPDDGTGVVERLIELVRERYGVPRGILWGNVASAINGAARQLAGARPDLAARAYASADARLADPRLEGGTHRSGSRFRRRSCCLIYQASGSTVGICGDCVLSSRRRPAG